MWYLSYTKLYFSCNWNFAVQWTFIILVSVRWCRTGIHHWDGTTLQLILFYLFSLLPPSMFQWRLWSLLKWEITQASFNFPINKTLWCDCSEAEFHFFCQTDDPAQKNTLLVFKFLPLMIGYFALSVPSGLSIYWLVSLTLKLSSNWFIHALDLHVQMDFKTDFLY